MASEVGDGAEDAGSVADGVALVALFADADVDVEKFALRFDLAAGAIGVEIVAVCAFEASRAVPLSAAEMIIEDSQQLGVAVDQSLQFCARGSWYCLGESGCC